MALNIRSIDAHVPRVKTERLVLRDWRDADVEPWVEMHANPHVTEFLAGPSYTRERLESYAAEIRRRLRLHGYGCWAVEIPGVAAFAGVISLQDVPFDARFTPAREIGWRFAHGHWGKGYATEGAQAALRFGFHDLGCGEIVAFTAWSNVRSQRVMERLGMTHDPHDDFDHPRLEEGHPLRRHFLYRIRNQI